MRKLTMIAAGLALAFGAVPALARVDFTEVFVFGDSLVDSGNAYAFTGGAQPSIPPYTGGRFSDGANFADYVSSYYTGGLATAYLANPATAHNFAVGGATAKSTGAASAPQTFDGQLGYFLASGQTFTQTSLVVLTFGGNDVRDSRGRAPADVSFQESIDRLTAGIKTLSDRGARTILVTGLPDIGQLPEFYGQSQAYRNDLSTNSNTLNAAFKGVVDTDTNRANVLFFDLLQYQKDLIANPAAYGLPTPFNATAPCFTGGVSCDRSLYFDIIHPTTAVHRAIGASIVSQLNVQVTSVPEPATWGLMLVGFGAIGVAQRRTRRRRAAA